MSWWGCRSRKQRSRKNSVPFDECHQDCLIYIVIFHESHPFPAQGTNSMFTTSFWSARMLCCNVMQCNVMYHGNALSELGCVLAKVSQFQNPLACSSWSCNTGTTAVRPWMKSIWELVITSVDTPQFWLPSRSHKKCHYEHARSLAPMLWLLTHLSNILL